MANGVYKGGSGIYQQDTTATFEGLRERIKQSLKTKNKRIAEDRANQNVEVAMDRLYRRFHGLAPKLELKQAPRLRDYYQDDSLPLIEKEYKNRQTTLRSIKWHMTMVLTDDAIANTRMDAFTREAIRHFKARLIAREYSGCSINHCIGALRQVLRDAEEGSKTKGYEVSLPDFGKLKVREHHHERVVEPDEETIYATAARNSSKRHFVFFKMLINTGMEPGYAASQRWEDVQFDKVPVPFGWIRDRCKKTTSRERDIPMNEELHLIMLEWWIEHGRPDSGWVFPSPSDQQAHCPLSTFQTLHKRMFGRGLHPLRGKGKRKSQGRKDYGLHWPDGTELNYFRLYDLRHTFLTRLGREGCNATLIATIAGWTSTRMALRYVKHDLIDKANAIVKMNPVATGRTRPDTKTSSIMPTQDSESQSALVS